MKLLIKRLTVILLFNILLIGCTTSKPMLVSCSDMNVAAYELRTSTEYIKATCK